MQSVFIKVEMQATLVLVFRASGEQVRSSATLHAASRSTLTDPHLKCRYAESARRVIVLPPPEMLPI